MLNETFINDSDAVITTTNLLYATQVEATSATIIKNIYMPNIGNNIYTVVLGDNIGSDLKIIAYLTEQVIVPVTGITLDYSKKTIAVGTQTTLTSTIYPENATNQDVTWSSNNPTVAVVDENGVVTAISTGEGSVGFAEITASAADGTIAATCMIQVNSDGIDRDDHLIEVSSASGMPDGYIQVDIFLRNNTGLTDLDLSISYDRTALYLNKCQEGELFDSYSKSTISKLPYTISCLSNQPSETSGVLASLFFYVESGAVEGTQYPISVSVTKAKNGADNISLPVVSGGGTFTCEQVGPTIIPVSSIALSAEETSIYVDGTIDLDAVVKPDDATDKTVVWTTNNESVATVDANGIVTGISEGTVTITATTNGTDESGTQLKGRCRVTVSPAPIVPVAVTGIKLSSSSVTISENDGTYLIATISPQNADNKAITWASENESIAIVDENGFVRAISEGTTRVTVTTEDGGYVATCLVTVTAAIIPDPPEPSELPEPNVDTVIAVGSISCVRGETINVPVVISDNVGIEAMQMELTYDEGLTLTNVTTGEALSDLNFTPSGDYGIYPFILIWDGMSESISNGTMLTLTFKVDDDAETGQYNIGLRYTEGRIYNHDLANINPSIVRGTITVANYMPGDIDGDHTVTIKDVTFLRRYIAQGYNITVVEQALDVNRDGSVDIKDTTILRRFIAGGYGIELR